MTATDYSGLDRFCEELGVAIEKDIPLKEHCTFKIGGLCDRLVTADSEEKLRRLLPLIEESSLPLLVLGKGSNVLFSDEGFRGVVLLFGSEYAAIRLAGEAEVECGSGTTLAALCQFALEHGLTGLEFAYGIPGTVGGAILMNAGAYGGEMKDVLLSARHLDRQGNPGSFNREELALSYRRSVYSHKDLIITGGTFQLRKGGKAEIKAAMDDYMNRRRTKQPLELPSAGSTFKRPEGAYASALIDQCGLKGRQIGGARVSEKHAGFVVNAGGATAADVLALIEAVRQEVRAKTGYDLECEVRVIADSL